MALGHKTGGRKAGTPNKSTQKVREAIAKIASRNIKDFERWLADIEDPAKRCDIFLRAIEYHIPKLSRAEVTGEDGSALQVVVKQYGNPAT